MAGAEQKETSRSWVREIRIAVAPFLNSQPQEILETSSLRVVEIGRQYLVSYLFIDAVSIKPTGI